MRAIGLGRVVQLAEPAVLQHVLGVDHAHDVVDGAVRRSGVREWPRRDDQIHDLADQCASRGTATTSMRGTITSRTLPLTSSKMPWIISRSSSLKHAGLFAALHQQPKLLFGRARVGARLDPEQADDLSLDERTERAPHQAHRRPTAAVSARRQADAADLRPGHADRSTAV